VCVCVCIILYISSMCLVSQYNTHKHTYLNMTRDPAPTHGGDFAQMQRLRLGRERERERQVL
jgi:hypothetical protein